MDTTESPAPAPAPNLAAPPADARARRDQVLAECVDAQAAWAADPGRNLVLLFDGTGNIIGNHADTNVVRLLRGLVKHTADDTLRPAQIVYYDPGVGTENQFPASSVGAKFGQLWRRIAGLALGSGAFDNIAEAYEFLVTNYRAGDRIFLFGFSRGAFTARAVGGMVNMYGLVQRSGLPLTRMLVNNYFSPRSDRRKDVADDIVKQFSLGRTPLIHFTGVWDTVETIGSGFLGGVSITNASDLAAKRFVHVRHGLALHETRCKYTPRRYVAPEFSADELLHRSFDERWFRGVHSDVGGSYKRDGLARISLKWMADEARGAGLLVDPAAFVDGDATTPMHDQTYESPYWAWTGINARPRVPSDVLDQSALPMADVRPAESIPRSTPLVQAWGWVLTLAVIGLGWMANSTATDACTFGALTSALANWPLPLQFLAPWHVSLGVLCDHSKMVLALRWDWGLLAAYFMWLPYPVTWALRRLAARAIPSGRPLSALQRRAQWVMLALVLADTVENSALYWHADAAWSIACVIATASLIKWSTLVMLTSIVVGGALATVPVQPVRRLKASA